MFEQQGNKIEYQGELRQKINQAMEQQKKSQEAYEKLVASPISIAKKGLSPNNTSPKAISPKTASPKPSKIKKIDHTNKNDPNLREIITNPQESPKQIKKKESPVPARSKEVQNSNKGKEIQNPDYNDYLPAKSRKSNQSQQLRQSKSKPETNFAEPVADNPQDETGKFETENNILFIDDTKNTKSIKHQDQDIENPHYETKTPQLEHHKDTVRQSRNQTSKNQKHEHPGKTNELILEPVEHKIKSKNEVIHEVQRDPVLELRNSKEVKHDTFMNSNLMQSAHEHNEKNHHPLKTSKVFQEVEQEKPHPTEVSVMRELRYSTELFKSHHNELEIKPETSNHHSNPRAHEETLNTKNSEKVFHHELIEPMNSLRNTEVSPPRLMTEESGKIKFEQSTFRHKDDHDMLTKSPTPIRVDQSIKELKGSQSFRKSHEDPKEKKDLLQNIEAILDSHKQNPIVFASEISHGEQNSALNSKFKPSILKNSQTLPTKSSPYTIDVQPHDNFAGYYPTSKSKEPKLKDHHHTETHHHDKGIQFSSEMKIERVPQVSFEQYKSQSVKSSLKKEESVPKPITFSTETKAVQAEFIDDKHVHYANRGEPEFINFISKAEKYDKIKTNSQLKSISSNQANAKGTQVSLEDDHDMPEYKVPERVKGKSDHQMPTKINLNKNKGIQTVESSEKRPDSETFKHFAHKSLPPSKSKVSNVGTQAHLSEEDTDMIEIPVIPDKLYFYQRSNSGKPDLESRVYRAMVNSVKPKKKEKIRKKSLRVIPRNRGFKRNRYEVIPEGMLPRKTFSTRRK